MSNLVTNNVEPEEDTSVGPASSIGSICPLPATGQGQWFRHPSFSYKGDQVNCVDSEVPAGQDGLLRMGCPTFGKARFVDNGDGTVSDNCTGLMWQKASPTNIYTWFGALNYGQTLELANYNDWRLPNIRELQSLIDYGRAYPAVDPVFSISALNEDVYFAYWSCTTDIRYRYPPDTFHKAWGVFLDGAGDTGSFQKNFYSRVLVVRGGQSQFPVPPAFPNCGPFLP